MDKQVSSLVGQKRLWLVRLGRKDEYASLALTENVISINFGIKSDLGRCRLRAEIAPVVASALPKSPSSLQSNITGQLHRFANEIVAGDMVVCPLRKSSVFAIGEVAGPYQQLADGRAARPVRWLSLNIPRSRFGQDLLYSLGALMTVCEIRRPNGVARVAAIAETGFDPG